MKYKILKYNPHIYRRYLRCKQDINWQPNICKKLRYLQDNDIQLTTNDWWVTNEYPDDMI